MNKTATVHQLAELISGEVIGDGDRPIDGVASPQNATPTDIIFIEQPKFIESLATTQAGAAIVPDGVDVPERMSGICFPHPALGFARVLDHLYPRQRNFTAVSPQAHIDEGAEIAPGVGVGPGAYIGRNVKIGAGSEIFPNSTVGDNTKIGEHCVLYSGVHVYHDCVLGNRVTLHSGVVIGSDGYGYVQEPMPQTPDEPLRHHKVAQIGRVVVEDDVEVGANTTIDRAAIDETRIGRGTKVDNLVMLAHNTRVGRHCLVVSQVGVSGSCDIGDFVTIAGQAGLTGHLKIGARAVIGAQAGITKDVKSGAVVFGSPAMDARKARMAFGLISSLPKFKNMLLEHSRRLAKLEKPDGQTADGS